MKKSELSHVKIYLDGGCLSNGQENPVAYGSFQVCAVHKQTGEEVVVRNSGRMLFPELSTNNQAEYAALIKAVEYVIGLHHAGFRFHTAFFTDSQLVREQLVGSWKVKDDKLKALHAEAKQLLDKLHSYEIIKVSRAAIVEVLGH